MKEHDYLLTEWKQKKYRKYLNLNYIQSWALTTATDLGHYVQYISGCSAQDIWSNSNQLYLFQATFIHFRS